LSPQQIYGSESNRPEQTFIRKIIAEAQRPVCLDLGAHVGEDASRMLNAAFDAGRRPKILMVEPDPRNVERIKMSGILQRRGADLSLIHGAIAEHSGRCDFHMCDNASNQAFASGSIRKPTGHLQHFPWCTFKKIESVPCFSLDDLMVEHELDHIDVLWVDIQGAEKDMILGGPAALARTRYLYVEAESVEFYEGQALRPELLAMLPDFSLIEEFDYNLLLRNDKLQGAAA
jgi:2-O-methyltransferase